MYDHSLTSPSRLGCSARVAADSVMSTSVKRSGRRGEYCARSCSSDSRGTRQSSSSSSPSPAPAPARRPGSGSSAVLQ